MENNLSARTEIDPFKILAILWSEKLFILKISVVSGIASVVIALLLPNYYKSTAILEIAESSSSMGGLGQYSDIASVVGINISSDSQSKSIRVIETIKSREFVAHLITKEDLAPSLIAPESYNSESKKLEIDSSKYNPEKKEWVESFIFGDPTPSVLDIHKKYIEDIISISQDKRSNLITISVEHLSPVFAKNFLSLIINEANTLSRERDLKESSDALRYLESQLSKISQIEIRDSLNKLIQMQLETQMLANISKDYVLKSIEPPYIPERKSRPSRAIICIALTLAGAFLSIIFVLVQHILLKKK
tara:strand:+ start:745 stop:1659 length:915 start_codon:yes stop_codon:yes gene_type:complete